MSIGCGIVGLPNVGKSTLFNALTGTGIDAQNFPFCTIEPNVGLVSVPDPRLDNIVNIVSPKSVIPSVMKFVDIAGLVKGASKGEGLGNQFLANIRECHAILHVVRCFEDSEIVHVADAVSPKNDVDVINIELILADLETLQKISERLKKQLKSGNKEIQQQYEVIEKACDHLNAMKPLRSFEVSEDDSKFLNTFQLLTLKPMLYVGNVSEDREASAKYEAILSDIAKEEGCEVIFLSHQLESEIAELPLEERMSFLADLGIEEPGLNQVIRSSYGLLGLQSYFTAGEKEVRSWVIKVGMTAPQAAGVIHSDFEKGFIRAELIGYSDYEAYQGEAGAKEAGKWRLVGKDYIVQDGDVMHFRFNV